MVCIGRSHYLSNICIFNIAACINFAQCSGPKAVQRIEKHYTCNIRTLSNNLFYTDMVAEQVVHDSIGIQIPISTLFYICIGAKLQKVHLSIHHFNTLIYLLFLIICYYVVMQQNESGSPFSGTLQHWLAWWVYTDIMCHFLCARLLNVSTVVSP